MNLKSIQRLNLSHDASQLNHGVNIKSSLNCIFTIEIRGIKLNNIIALFSYHADII